MKLPTINPGLFARIMSLPDSARLDLLEYLGATVVGEAHLADMIDKFQTRLGVDGGGSRQDDLVGLI